MAKKEKEKSKKVIRIRPKREKFPQLTKRDIKSIKDERKRQRQDNPGVPPDRTFESWPYPTGGS